MFAKFLSAVFSLVLILGLASTAQADVTGSFDLDIALNPEGTQTEAVKFEIDLQSNLQVNITISGLTFGMDLGFGVTGIEFAVLSVTTNLGALSVFDQFVFAEPFGCAAFNGGGGGQQIGLGGGLLFGQCAGNQVVAIGDGDGDGVADNAVGFVKKRIGLELNIAGITLSNLALFEDVDFPDIQGLNAFGQNDHEHDHFGTNEVYFVNMVNNTVDDQTPTFGFGDVISVSGQTVSGITLTGSTMLCASGVNYIKKRSWLWEVNKACTASFGNNDLILEDGAKTPLLFEQEVLEINGVEVGGVEIDMTTIFVPFEPVFSVIEAAFTLLDIADVTVVLTSDNITSLSINGISVTVVTGNVVLSLSDFDGDLEFDRYVLVLSTVLNPNQNPADLNITAVGFLGVGLTQLNMTLGISRGPFNFSSTTRFAGDSGELNWAFTTFDVFFETGNGMNVAADLIYTPEGMGTNTISIGVTF